MKGIVFALFSLILFIVVARVGFAVTPTSDIYSAASEAERYTGASSTICQVADPSCSDLNYTASDIYTVMGDGSTSASSGASIRNSSNSQTAYMKLVFDFDDVLSGDYYIRFYSTSTISWSGAVYPYINETHINTTHVVYFKTTPGEWWSEVKVTDFIDDITGGRVALRLYATGSTAQTLTEVYVKRPPRPYDFQVIDQGVHIARLGEYVENEWMVVTPEDSFRISNATCELFQVKDGLTNVSLNVTVLPGSGSEADRLKVYWFANETLVQEGKNYELSCDAQFNGIYLTGLEQYIYITQERSAELAFQKILAWVKSLFMSLTVETSVVERPLQQGVAQQVLVEVLKEKMPIINAQCYATIYNESMGIVVNNQSMSYYTGGYYNFTFTADEVQKSYVVESTCYVNNTENVSGYQATGVLQSVVSSVDEIYEGTPTIDLLSQRFYAGAPSQVVLRLSVGSNSVANANCWMTIYNSTFGKVVDNQTMTYSGEDGMYYRNWTPQQFVASNYPTRVVCQGGALGTKVVQAAASMTVDDGVVMQSVA